jgi:hypothetical protein
MQTPYIMCKKYIKTTVRVAWVIIVVERRLPESKLAINRAWRKLPGHVIYAYCI